MRPAGIAVPVGGTPVATAMLHLGATGVPRVLSLCEAVLQFMRQSLGRLSRRFRSL